MNFKARLNKVLEKLGFVKKFENKSLTSEEYKALCEEYQKEYQSTLVDDLAAENSAAEEAEHQQQINSLYAIVSKANNAAGDGNDGDDDDEDKDPDDGKKNENSQQPAGASQNVSYEQLTKAVSGLAENVMKMAQGTAPDKPAAHVTAPSIPINGFESNSNYLFGVEHSLFDMKKRWNQITVNPALALASEPDEESDGKAFRRSPDLFSSATSITRAAMSLVTSRRLLLASSPPTMAVWIMPAWEISLLSSVRMLLSHVSWSSAILPNTSQFVMVCRTAISSSMPSSMRYLRAISQVRSTRVACSSRTRWVTWMTP